MSGPIEPLYLSLGIYKSEERLSIEPAEGRLGKGRIISRCRDHTSLKRFITCVESGETSAGDLVLRAVFVSPPVSRATHLKGSRLAPHTPSSPLLPPPPPTVSTVNWTAVERGEARAVEGIQFSPAQKVAEKLQRK